MAVHAAICLRIRLLDCVLFVAQAEVPCARLVGLLFFGYGTYSIHINSLASAVAGFGAWAVVACVLWHVCGRCMASCDDQSYRAKDAGQVASSDEQHDLAQGIGATDADTH